MKSLVQKHINKDIQTKKLALQCKKQKKERVEYINSSKTKQNRDKVLRHETKD